MTIRRFRSMALAGVAASALAAGQALAQDCQEELQQIQAQIEEQQIAEELRADVDGLAEAAETLYEAGDEEGCLAVVDQIRQEVAQAEAIDDEEEVAAEPDEEVEEEVAAEPDEEVEEDVAAEPDEEVEEEVAAEPDEEVDEEVAEREERLQHAQELQGVVGLETLREIEVVSRDGEDLGNITDMVVDLGQREVRYVILEVDGGEGAGQLHPIPLDAFRIVYDDEAPPTDEAPADQEWAETEEDAEPALAEQPDEQPEAEVAEQPDEQPEAEVAERERHADHPAFQMTAGEVEGMNVINAHGENIGSVNELYYSHADDDVLAVVSVGGFLGFGTHDVGLPLSQMQLGEDELLLDEAITTDHLEEMPEAEYTAEQVIPSDMVIADAVLGMADQPAQHDAEQQDEQALEQREQQQQEQLAAEEQQQQEQLAAEEQQQEEEQLAAEPRERRDFENAMLVLQMDADALEGAPSFSADEQPNFDDPGWQDSVDAFYQQRLNLNGANDGELLAD